MYDEKFVAQLRLLLMCLPSVAEENVFALKGGTAINLFFDNLPRLSVDIDLTYLPIEDRDTTISGIKNGLLNINKKIKETYPKFNIKPVYDKDHKIILKLLISSKDTAIKIEPNFTLRGALHPIVKVDLCEKVKQKFDVDLINVPVLDNCEVFAGKLCATLSRQHPRDLFDMMRLLKQGPISDRIRQAFVVYLASSQKPMHEILAPNLLDIKSVYENEFYRMTEEPINLSDLLDVRDYLIKNVKTSLTINEREFLYSLKQGRPKYALLPFNNLADLPAIKWKLLNINKMDKRKSAIMQARLAKVLEL